MLADCASLALSGGTRTALMIPPGLEFFAMFFALFKAGAVPVLIDPGIGLKPLKHCLAEAAPEAFIGITRAQAAHERYFAGAPASISKLVTAGPKLGWGGINSRQLASLGQRTSGAVLENTRPGKKWRPSCSPPEAQESPRE